jgi:plastocyanin
MHGRILLAILTATAACGGGHGDDVVTIDSPASSTNTVTTVDCASNAATATVVTQNFMFSPMATTITVGQVVKFQLESSHDVGPDPSTTTDPGLSVDFGGTACLKFAKAGTFGFKCTVHNFTGSITVN